MNELGVSLASRHGAVNGTLNSGRSQQAVYGKRTVDETTEVA